MKRGRLVLCAVVALAGLMFVNTNMAAQILQIGELNTQQIWALDLAKTVVLLPGDILEEHGPYLPSFTDGSRSLIRTANRRSGCPRPWLLAHPSRQLTAGVDPADNLGA